MVCNATCVFAAYNVFKLCLRITHFLRSESLRGFKAVAGKRLPVVLSTTWPCISQSVSLTSCQRTADFCCQSKSAVTTGCKLCGGPTIAQQKRTTPSRCRCTALAFACQLSHELMCARQALCGRYLGAAHPDPDHGKVPGGCRCFVARCAPLWCANLGMELRGATVTAWLLHMRPYRLPQHLQQNIKLARSLPGCSSRYVATRWPVETVTLCMQLQSVCHVQDETDFSDVRGRCNYISGSRCIIVGRTQTLGVGCLTAPRPASAIRSHCGRWERAA